MFDTSPEAILRYISDGESQRVEFKSRLPKFITIERLLNSFANTEGGLVLIGVSDHGEINGVSYEAIPNVMSRLKMAAQKQFSWPVEIGVVEIDRKNIVYAAIDPAPHALAPVRTSDGRVFFRAGTNVSAPTNEEVRHFYGVISEAKPKFSNKETIDSQKDSLIFLSYAREDLELVQQLYTRLKVAELNPWMDKPPRPYELDGIPYGKEWDEVVKQKITKARVVLAFLSKRSVEKMGYVQKEFRIALGLQALRPSGSVYLIPTLLEDCAPPAYSVENISFKNLQWYNLLEEGDLPLIRYLQTLTGVNQKQTGRTVADSFGINVYDLKSRHRRTKKH